MNMNLIKALQENRKNIHEQAKAILDTAEAAHRDLNADEQKRFNDMNDNLDAMNARIEQLRDFGARKEDADAALAEVMGNGNHGTSGRGFLDFRPLATSARREAESAGGFNVRALLAAGSTAGHPQMLTNSPVSLGKPATALLDIIPARTVDDGVYSYLKQTIRANLAAPVAVGALKPASVMTLTRINGALEVVAHISEAINELWLQDVDGLEQFVRDELSARHRHPGRHRFRGDGS